MTPFFAFLTLGSVLSAVGATPVLESRKSLEVFDPAILIPNAATVWQAGTTQNVTWDTSTLPSSTLNTGTIVLRSADFNGPTPGTLAFGFLLLAGTQEITLPANLTTRDDYEIVLFGDSGNISPEFTIVA